MTKRYRVFKIDNNYGVSDDIANYTLAWDTSKRIMDGLCDKLNEQDQRISELEEELCVTRKNMNGLSFDNYLQHKQRMEVGIEAAYYDGIVKYIKSTGIIALMEDNNLTWEEIYNIVQKAIKKEIFE